MNEIDELLKNLKKNPSSRRIKVDAQTYLDSLKEGKSSEEASLDATITALNKEIEKDFGIQAPTHVSDFSKLAQFEGIHEVIKQKIFGQEAYIDQLMAALKRPFVMGSEENVLNKILICGDKGSGRHSVLSQSIDMLYQKKVFQTNQISVLDCSLYQSSEDEKLLIQDLYMAISSASSVLLFDHLDQLYHGFIPYITELTAEGTLTLKKRYGIQNHQLVEANTTLLTQAIAKLEIKKKYLIFMSEKSVSEITSLFGNAFIQNIQDAVTSEKLSEEACRMILEKYLQALIKKCKKQLNYEVTLQDSLKQYMIQHRDIHTGAYSLEKQVNDLYTALASHKLNHEFKELKIELSAKDQIYLTMNEVKQPLSAIVSTLAQDEIADVKKGLSEIVGLQEVKQYIETLEANVKMQQLRAASGLKSTGVSMHMIFTGNPGTGKTTIARLIARYLKALGVLSSGQLIEVTRADLVGKYVGHTAPLTNNMIKSALGGVLFIDEAYALYRGKDDSFGLEAIDTLVKGMEDNKDNLVVILAGYTKEMNDFLEANSGLRSRFPNMIEFKDYTAEEMLAITKKIAESKDYHLHASCDEKLLAYYADKQLHEAKTSGNGRLARNKVEEAILNQARRCLQDPALSIDELRIEDFDLTK